MIEKIRFLISLNVFSIHLQLVLESIEESVSVQLQLFSDIEKPVVLLHHGLLFWPIRFMRLAIGIIIVLMPDPDSSIVTRVPH